MDSTIEFASPCFREWLPLLCAIALNYVLEYFLLLQNIVHHQYELSVSQSVEIRKELSFVISIIMMN